MEDRQGRFDAAAACTEVGLAVAEGETSQDSGRHNAKSDEIPVARYDLQGLLAGTCGQRDSICRYNDQEQQAERDHGVSLEGSQVEGRDRLGFSERGEGPGRKYLRPTLPN